MIASRLLQTLVARLAARRIGESAVAARILPFRSLVPALKQVEFAPTSGALYDLRSPCPAPKVVTMSKHARSRSHRMSLRDDVRFLPAERELRDGYVEVGHLGISLQRLADVYAVLIRDAWDSALGSVRSLLRPATSGEA